MKKYCCNDKQVCIYRYISLLLSNLFRWFSEQLYVNGTKNLLDGYTTNSAGGTTISVAKRGGWGNAWADAQRMAGWV